MFSLCHSCQLSHYTSRQAVNGSSCLSAAVRGAGAVADSGSDAGCPKNQVKFKSSAVTAWSRTAPLSYGPTAYTVYAAHVVRAVHACDECRLR